jgi:hypothetical protein
MNKTYNKIVFAPLICSLVTNFIFLFNSTDACAQKTGEKKYKKVTFKKDARTNGYTIKIKKDTVWLQVINVKKPVDSTKLFEGIAEFEFNCSKITAWIKLKLDIKSGQSKPVVLGTVSDPASGNVKVPDLSITICEGMALDSYQWHQDFVIKGNIPE